jgi:quercetin dioxygenase-like cupin family protein
MAVPVSSSMVPAARRTFDNPATGERLVIRTSGAETGGQLLAFDLFLPPRGHVPAQHAHPTQEERFTVVDGVLRFRVGGRTIVASAGESLRIPPRTAHWFGNPGPLPAHARVEVRPALRMEELLEAGTLLAHSGPFARWHIPAPAALVYLLLEFQQELAVPYVPPLLLRIVLRPFAWLGGASPARRAAQT